MNAKLNPTQYAALGKEIFTMRRAGRSFDDIKQTLNLNEYVYYRALSTYKKAAKGNAEKVKSFKDKYFNKSSDFVKFSASDEIKVTLPSGAVISCSSAESLKLVLSVITSNS